MLEEKGIEELIEAVGEEEARLLLEAEWIAEESRSEDEDEAVSRFVDKMGNYLDRLAIARAGAKAELDEAVKIYGFQLARIESAQKRVKSFLLWQRERGFLPDKCRGEKRGLTFVKRKKVVVSPLGEAVEGLRRISESLVRVKVEPDLKAIKARLDEGDDLDGWADVEETVTPQFRWRKR